MFCNPPYSGDKARWLRKAWESAQAGAEVVVLVPARSDAVWFHDWILGKAELRVPRPRLRFQGFGPNAGRWTAPRDGSLLAIYRPGPA